MGLFDVFTRKPKAQPPYDVLTEEQRYGLYFLLDYFGTYATEKPWDFIKQDAFNYLEKAAWYLGLTNQQLQEMKPNYNNYEKIARIVKGINNKLALEYMANNCYNLILMIDDYDKHKKMSDQFYSLWAELGFSREDVRFLIKKYMYRTDI